MRIVEVTLYRFAELPTDEAKDRARQWWRESVDNDPSDITDCIAEPVVAAAGLLGVSINNRGRALPAIYWDTNPIGGTFDGSWSMPREGAPRFGDAIRAEFPQDATLHRIADALDAVRDAVIAVDPEGHAYATIRTARRGMGVSVESGIDLSDDDATAPDIHDDLESALSDFAHWIGTLADAECDYRASDEYVDECLIANEYEFTADGRHA